MPHHIVVALSGHGFGHLAQTVAVFEKLLESRQDIRITLRTSLPETILRERFPGPFDYEPAELDRGMVMTNALEVAVKESCAWYQAFHRDYAARVAAEASALTRLKPDLVYANVPYLSLAAARRAEVPTIALCSINWAEIFRIYCRRQPGADDIYHEILESYQAAELFLLPEPSAPMPGLANTRPIGPVGQRGRDRRQALRRQLGIEPSTRLVLFGLGGIATDLHGGEWSAGEALHWIVPDNMLDNMETRLGDATPASKLRMPFVDLLASCDLVITKTGYGTIVEAALAGVPVLCAERGDGWPEEPGLFDWMREHGRIRVIDWERLRHGAFHDEIETLLQEKDETRAAFPDGAKQAARILARRLEGLPA
ncbi:MAG: hypothetical protein U9Q71_00985 [Pseudomonadota bacterium]|nr:hypothetical protein [Pseudomonadota bacterium]